MISFSTWAKSNFKFKLLQKIKSRRMEFRKVFLHEMIFKPGFECRWIKFKVTIQFQLWIYEHTEICPDFFKSWNRKLIISKFQTVKLSYLQSENPLFFRFDFNCCFIWFPAWISKSQNYFQDFTKTNQTLHPRNE